MLFFFTAKAAKKRSYAAGRSAKERAKARKKEKKKKTNPLFKIVIDKTTLTIFPFAYCKGEFLKLSCCFLPRAFKRAFFAFLPAATLRFFAVFAVKKCKPSGIRNSYVKKERRELSFYVLSKILWIYTILNQNNMI